VILFSDLIFNRWQYNLIISILTNIHYVVTQKSAKNLTLIFFGPYPLINFLFSVKKY